MDTNEKGRSRKGPQRGPGITDAHGYQRDIESLPVVHVFPSFANLKSTAVHEQLKESPSLLHVWLQPPFVGLSHG